MRRDTFRHSRKQRRVGRLWRILCQHLTQRHLSNFAEGLAEKVVLYRRVALSWMKLRRWGPPCPRDIFLGVEHEQSFANVTSSRYAPGPRSGIPSSPDSGPAVKYLIGSSPVL